MLFVQVLGWDTFAISTTLLAPAQSKLSTVEIRATAPSRTCTCHVNPPVHRVGWECYRGCLCEAIISWRVSIVIVAEHYAAAIADGITSSSHMLVLPTIST